MDAKLAILANIVIFAVLGAAAFGFIMWCIETIYHSVSQVTVHHRIADWLDAHAAPEWRLAHRLRSVQIAVFWAVLGGLWIALPAFQSYLSPVRFAMACVGFSLAICFARLTGQKGLPDA
jgi:hypothetical protein